MTTRSTRLTVKHTASALMVATVALASPLAGPFASSAIAAEYPSKPVTLVVPYKAGGSTETMARVFGKALGNELGVPVVIKTRPGAGGAVGATEVAAAGADGHTLLFAATASLLWPPLAQKVEFDLNSFRYIAQITEYQQAIVVKGDSSFNSLSDLIKHSKSNAGLNYADQSAMSRAYINYIGKQEGVDWTGVPTKGGGEMVPFLLGGKVDFAWSGGVHNRYGEKIKVLASMNGSRLSASPDVPSIKEKYGISMPSQAVIVAPAAVPDAVSDRLQSAIEAATQDKDFVELLSNKLKFPVKFVGADALKTDIDATVTAMKSVLAATQ
ncbi:MAG: tripartite tricarboxylate transporter substrate binding protein [Burkholderiaceae bacterium]